MSSVVRPLRPSNAGIIIDQLRMVLAFLLCHLPIFSHFYKRVENPIRTDVDRSSLKGKNVIITGANAGIGFGITYAMLARGANVTMACRNAEKAGKARQVLLQRLAAEGKSTEKADSRLEILALDVSSLESVRAFAEGWNKRPAAKKTIDLLFLNAGIAGLPGGKVQYTKDEHQFEFMYAANVLGHHLLTSLLLPSLSKAARIVFTSSLASYDASLRGKFSDRSTPGKSEVYFHTRPLTFAETFFQGLPKDASPEEHPDMLRYGQTKGMQAVAARKLQAVLDEQASSTGDADHHHRLVFAHHPGGVASSIIENTTGGASADLKRDGLMMIFIARMISAFGMDLDEGAACAVYLGIASEAEVARYGGGFFDRSQFRRNPAHTLKQEQLDRWWNRWNNDAGLTAKDWIVKA